jgi:hypothetical protein
VIGAQYVDEREESRDCSAVRTRCRLALTPLSHGGNCDADKPREISPSEAEIGEFAEKISDRALGGFVCPGFELDLQGLVVDLGDIVKQDPGHAAEVSSPLDECILSRLRRLLDDRSHE